MGTMKKKATVSDNTITALSENIHAANTYFLNKAQKQFNTAWRLETGSLAIT